MNAKEKRYSAKALEASENEAAVLLIGALKANKMTFGTAESCTCGMIAAKLGDFPGVSEYFLGGIVSYANEVKENVLGVSRGVIESVGAVSEECASAMAVGAIHALGCSAAVSVTGIAGPGGGSDAKPVGTVCFGLALSAKDGDSAEKIEVLTETVRFGDRFELDDTVESRTFVRKMAVIHALRLAAEHIGKN